MIKKYLTNPSNENFDEGRIWHRWKEEALCKFLK
jgi:hypothetical protein